MKKLLKPEMEFIKFNTEDVITTSGGRFGFPYDGNEKTPGSEDKSYGAVTFNK